MEQNNTWNNAEGYGLFCGKKCAAARRAAGIPPKAGKAAKLMSAQADLDMAKAALAAQNQEDRSWSPMAVTGVVLGSLLGIALMVVIITRARNKK